MAFESLVITCVAVTTCAQSHKPVVADRPAPLEMRMSASPLKFKGFDKHNHVIFDGYPDETYIVRFRVKENRLRRTILSISSEDDYCILTGECIESNPPLMRGRHVKLWYDENAYNVFPLLNVGDEVSLILSRDGKYIGVHDVKLAGNAGN